MKRERDLGKVTPRKKVGPRRGLGARGLTHIFLGKTAPSYPEVQPVHAQNGDEDSELIVRARVATFFSYRCDRTRSRSCGPRLPSRCRSSSSIGRRCAAALGARRQSRNQTLLPRLRTNYTAIDTGAPQKPCGVPASMD